MSYFVGKAHLCTVEIEVFILPYHLGHKLMYRLGYWTAGAVTTPYGYSVGEHAKKTPAASCAVEVPFA